jgi:hypothetical protein
MVISPYIIATKLFAIVEESKNELKLVISLEKAYLASQQYLEDTRTVKKKKRLKQRCTML